MKSWLNRLRKHKGYVLTLVILGGLTTLLLAPEISRLSLWNLRETEVTVTLQPQEKVRIAVTDNLAFGEERVSPSASLSFEELEKRLVRSSGFEIVKGEDGLASFQGTAPGSSITFLLPQRPETHISFLPQPEGGIVEVSAYQGRTVTIDTGLQEEPVFRYYPFSFGQTKYLLANSILLYTGVFLASLVAWSLILAFVRKFAPGNPGTRAVDSRILFLLILGGTFLVLSLEYFLHKELYQVAFPADAYYYLHPMAEGGDGGFSLQVFMENLYSFRGYFPSAMSLILESMSEKIGLDPIYLHYLFISFLAALTFGVAIPRAYKSWRFREATWFQAGGLYLLFLVFYGNDLFFTLSDAPSTFGAVAGLAFLLWGVQEGGWWKYALGGFLVGLASAYRASYGLMANLVLAGIVLWLLGSFFSYFRKNFRREHKGAAKGISKPLQALFFPLGLLLILWPQIFINNFKGISGLYPADISWVYDPIQQQSQSLTEYSVYHGLQGYYYVPYLVKPMGKDQQMNEVILSDFPGKALSKHDDLHLLVKDPLGFGTILLKKAFWGFNKSPGGTYLPPRISSEGFNNLYRSLNYGMIIISLYYLYRRKERDSLLPDKVRWPVLGLLAITAGPQLLLHIEWRYFMFPHLLLMFLFAYFFTESLGGGEEGRWKPGHILTLALLILGANAIHFTMLENFLL